MASRSAADRRKTYRTNTQQMYVYGNTVPKPEYQPGRRIEEPEKKKKASRQVRKNRRKALHMNAGYVVFLTVAALLALIVCVNYVRLQSSITSRSKNITALQQELADMKEENNTKYNVIMDSVNLEEVRNKAENELGMYYANPDQIVEYQNPSGDYVKQYEDIPENGVLASSSKAKD